MVDRGAETGTVGVSRAISTNKITNRSKKSVHLVIRFLEAVEEGASKMDLL